MPKPMEDRKTRVPPESDKGNHVLQRIYTANFCSAKNAVETN